MIHKFYLNKFYIVLDVESGAVHIVDKLAYEMLDLIDEFNFPKECDSCLFEELSSYSAKDIESTYNELYQLYENGELFSEDIQIPELEKFTKDAPIKAMCLNVAHDCNLKCDYCFASKGDYTTGKKLMSFETGKNAIDFCVKNSGNRKNIEIDYFGGEPLMNFDVVKKITEYAKEQGRLCGKNFRFTITTNGMLLDDEKIDYINREMSNVVLSLDGRKKVNDKIRKRYDGNGSYDTIVPKYKNLIASRGDKDYYIRGTFTAYNTDFCDDLLEMSSLGFKHLSIEPVICNENEAYAIRDKHLEEINAEYEKLASLIIENKKNNKEFNFFHYLVDIDGGPCAIKRVKGCGCGGEYISVTPEGDIYPCHQFIGKENFIMGNVFEKKLDQKLKQAFEKANLYSKTKCENCFAKYYCSGGCNANNYEFNTDILEPVELSCILQRKRLECSLMIKAALAFIN